MQPTVSVIIPTQNRSVDLHRCIESVRQQTFKKIECIVVDNASRDGTVEMLRSFSDVIVVKNKRNVGAAEARNQGIRCAHGDYVWFLDSDTEVENPRCLESMLAIMKAQNDIGAIGGELVNLTDGSQIMKVKFVRRNGETFTKTIFPSDTELHNCDYLATCNCFVRKETVVFIGGFDPAYFFLSEDKQLGFDIRRMGFRNVACVLTAACHNISSTSGRRSLFLKQRNVLRYAIINNSTIDIILLPFYEIYYFFCMSRLNDLKNLEKTITKYVDSDADSNSLVWKMLRVGVRYIGVTVIAYLWNILMLRKTISVRIKRPNYL